MQKEVLILGSTGSIGRSTLDVVRQHPDKFRVKTLIANSNITVLAAQVRIFKPDNIGIYDESLLLDLEHVLGSMAVNIVAGENAINELFCIEYDVTIAAISGMACLHPLIKVMEHTKVVGLANKESIVCAGTILMEHAKRYNTKIVPVDSEHSAIFQILEDRNHHNVEQVILTASGGPFLNRSLDEMTNITPTDAVSHPVWSMGSKISVDSATLMNKGLEVIEAHYLFNMSVNKLSAVIHPQALIHGIVQYDDGSMLAQLAIPDMRTPIALALNYPFRVDISHNRPTWGQLSKMTFQDIDASHFKCFALAMGALKAGQGRCIQLNAANEVAVQAFLYHQLPFLDIARVIEDVLNALPDINIKSIQDVFAVAETATHCAKKHCGLM